MDTQTQIERLIELAIVQRTELRELVEQLPTLREHLNAEIERTFEEAEPQIRTELEEFCRARATDEHAKTGAALAAKVEQLSKQLEVTTAAKYSVLMAERAENANLLAKAEARIEDAASMLSSAVKEIVTDELSRFPRAGEIDQLRKEFAEPRGLNPRGRWMPDETYQRLDLVTINGDSFVSNIDGNRERPSRTAGDWTLNAARGNGGGGGVTSLTDLVAVPANGELLIGNGSAFVNNTLTAGTGVTITNGPGTITIDASGAQEILTATVTNAESVAITRGQVVYLFGATGNRASVKLANNATDAESSKTFGVVSEASIAAGANGLVTCVGTVDKLTLGSYTEGDVLYLGATPGSVTATKPYAPNHLVYVGIVERANNGNGELYVRIQNGFELDEIHDVQITAPPLAGSLLMRDATNSLWKANRLTGTANQVTVTNADTSVTLSLPTTIANVNSVTAATTQNLTLAGGSTGASLVLGQGANGAATVTAKGTGKITNIVANASSVEFTDAASATFRLTPSGTPGAGLITIGTSSLNTPLAFAVNDSGVISEGMRLKAGNLLIGTTTDGGQKLQVAGTGYFSGDFSSAGTITSIGANDGYFIATRSTASRYALFTYRTGVADDWVIGLRGSGEGFSDDLTYRNGSGAVVSRLSKAGAATFAGAVTATGAVTSGAQYVITGNGTVPTASTIAVGTNGAGSRMLLNVPSAGEINFNVNGSLVSAISSTRSFYATQVMESVNTTASTNTTSGALVVTGGVGVGGALNVGGAATFAGAVAINNTVATAVAVASTHKVTMVIGGVTYYLLATNVP